MSRIVELIRPAAGMRRRWTPESLPVLAAVGVLLLALVSAAGTSAMDVGMGWTGGAGGWAGDEQPVCTAEEAAMDPPPPHCPQDIRASSQVRSTAAVGLGVVMLVILALFVFSVVVTIWGLEFKARRQVRDGGSNAAPVSALRGAPQARAAMRCATRRALDELRRPTGNDPADAVTAAWLALEQAAAEAGSARAAHQTSAEFTAAVLARHDVDTAALDRLRKLYLRARFSTERVVTAADIDAAADALETLVDDLSEGRV